MRQSHTFLTAIALNAAFSLAACSGGSGASSSSHVLRSSSSRAKKVFLAMCLPRGVGYELTPRFSMQIGLEPGKNPLSLSLSSGEPQPSGYGEGAATGPRNL